MTVRANFMKGEKGEYLSWSKRGKLMSSLTIRSQAASRSCADEFQ